MGSFKGHALPGSFFLLFGLWWSVKYPFRYLCQRRKATSFCPKAGFQRLEFTEGIIKVVCALVGMIVEQFATAGGPYLKLYNYEKKQWNYLMNWQHTTMYLFFGISGLVDIVVHGTKALPVALDRIMLSLAVFVEGFLFYYHTHGRAILDIHVHQLLIISIFGGAACVFLEVFLQDIIILELFRTSLCILQGSWFWQIGFILYPPSGSLEWNQMDHNNIMFATMCFCWHYAFALLIVSVNYAVVYWVIHSKILKIPSAETRLLKTSEQEQESEDEI